MSDFVFNISKGRTVELYNRVDTNDPANSAFVIVVVDVGSVTDAVLRDLDTLAAILGTSGVTERNANGWSRKTLTDADTGAWAPDDTNDRVDLDIPDQSWTQVSGGSSNASSDLLVCYDNDTTSGTDTSIVPCTMHDFVIVPDGSDVTAVIAAAGFFRAT